MEHTPVADIKTHKGEIWKWVPLDIQSAFTSKFTPVIKMTLSWKTCEKQVRNILGKSSSGRDFMSLLPNMGQAPTFSHAGLMGGPD